MKATFTFNLPEEQEEFAVFINARSIHAALHEFGEFLRSEFKYNTNLSSEKVEYLETVRNKFHEIVNNNGVN